MVFPCCVLGTKVTTTLTMPFLLESTEGSIDRVELTRCKKDLRNREIDREIDR
jgi:hypothetical protein